MPGEEDEEGGMLVLWWHRQDRASCQQLCHPVFHSENGSSGWIKRRRVCSRGTAHLHLAAVCPKHNHSKDHSA